MLWEKIWETFLSEKEELNAGLVEAPFVVWIERDLKWGKLKKVSSFQLLIEIDPLLSCFFVWDFDIERAISSCPDDTRQKMSWKWPNCLFNFSLKNGSSEAAATAKAARNYDFSWKKTPFMFATTTADSGSQGQKGSKQAGSTQKAHKQTALKILLLLVGLKVEARKWREMLNGRWQRETPLSQTTAFHAIVNGARLFSWPLCCSMGKARVQSIKANYWPANSVNCEGGLLSHCVKRLSSSIQPWIDITQ